MLIDSNRAMLLNIILDRAERILDLAKQGLNVAELSRVEAEQLNEHARAIQKRADQFLATIH